MKSRISLAATCMSLTMISGAAIGAQTNTFPVSIASHAELDMQDLARSMIHSLPVEQQLTIAAKRGLGGDAVDLSVTPQCIEDLPKSKVPHGTSAKEYLDMLASDDLRAVLTDQQLQVATNIAELMDEGKDMPSMCFAENTDPKYVWLITQLLDYQFVSDDGARFQQGNRWSRTAVSGNGLGQGDPTTITYSFAPDGSFVPNSGLGSGSSTLFQWLDGLYGSTAAWQSLFAQVFDRWSQLTGVTYIHELNDDGRNMSSSTGIVGVRGDVRIFAFNYPADGNFGVLAYNFFPNDGDMAIDAFDTFYNNTGGNSLRFRNVTAHEHGHGLGMAHVCPANQTKLMEPFVSTQYNGPQLDDILNGQRFYGDPLEPNDTTPSATDLGTYATSGVFNITEASIDDNADIDYFKVTLTDRAQILFTVAPNAGQYQQGPQTQSCNSGSNTNYNIVHDLQIQVYTSSDLNNPVASANNTGVGQGEILTYAAETPGDYFIRVSSVDAVNGIQRYLGSMIISALPPVVCPADLNNDGELNFFDVSAFLTEFNSMSAAGDFNNDGEYNFFDVSAFLTAFNTGCP